MTGVLPALRVQRATSVFHQRILAGDAPGHALTAALDTLEEGAERWGHACLECNRHLEVQDSRLVCPDHGLQSYGLHGRAKLLIAWDPVRS